MYAHLSRIVVTKGNSVISSNRVSSSNKHPIGIGDIIGLVGTTGNGGGQGSHLHFEALSWGADNADISNKLNPTTWIAAGSR
jgi:murein DD-endopeptidase MepM/ murein hydrolase activator NlpD